MKFTKLKRDDSQIVQEPSSPGPSSSSPVLHQQTPNRLKFNEDSEAPSFLKACASRWLHRSGGRAMQRASGIGAYDKLVAGEIAAEDTEQIELDVDRSTVDGLDELYASS